MIAYINTQDRDFRLDVIKGLCIALMVWAHLPSMGTWEHGFVRIARWIYTFHMPIFCLITGWLFGLKRGDVGEFWLVLNRMIKPYVVMSVISYGLYRLAARYGFSTSVQMPLDPWRIFLGYGGGALWYLYTFGIVELLALLTLLTSKRLSIMGKNELFLLILLTVGGGTSLMRAGGLNVWSHMVPIFLVGLFARMVDCKKLNFPDILFLFSLLVIVIMCSRFGLNMPPLALFVFQISVFVVLVKISERLYLMKYIGYALAFLGRHTLEILLFHNIISVGFRPASKMILRYDGTGLLLNLIMFLLVVSACLIIGAILRRAKFGRIVFGFGV